MERTQKRVSDVVRIPKGRCFLYVNVALCEYYIGFWNVGKENQALGLTVPGKAGVSSQRDSGKRRDTRSGDSDKIYYRKQVQLPIIECGGKGCAFYRKRRDCFQ